MWQGVVRRATPRSVPAASVLAALIVLAFAGSAAALVTVKPVRGSVVLERIREPDPDGGPPWGVRTFSIRYSPPCVQIGRVVGNQLGTVDDTGAFTPLPYTLAACSDNVLWGFEGMQTNVPARGCRYPGSALPPGPDGPVLDDRLECTPRQMRTVVRAFYDTDLVAARFANADGSGSRKLTVGERGNVIAVLPGDGGVRDNEQPRLSLTFDSGCRRLGRSRLQMMGARRVGRCRIVVPDLFGPRKAEESEASRQARLHPSAPVFVWTAPSGNVHPRVFFQALFHVPITVQTWDEGYVFRVRGPGPYPQCDGRIDETGSSGTSVTIREGTLGSVLVQPLEPSDHRRFCPGRFRVDVSFRRGQTIYPPFGHAWMRVPAVPAAAHR